MLFRRLQRALQGADNDRVASLLGDRPLPSESLGGNPVLPFPGRAVTLLLLLLLLPSQQPPLLPAPLSPGCQEPGSHSSARELSSPGEKLGVELLLLPRARGGGRCCRGRSQPYISSDERDRRLRNELTQPAGLTVVRQLLFDQQEPRESGFKPSQFFLIQTASILLLSYIFLPECSYVSLALETIFCKLQNAV